MSLQDFQALTLQPGHPDLAWEFPLLTHQSVGDLPSLHEGPGLPVAGSLSGSPEALFPQSAARLRPRLMLAHPYLLLYQGHLALGQWNPWGFGWLSSFSGCVFGEL